VAKIRIVLLLLPTSLPSQELKISYSEAFLPMKYAYF